MPKVILKKVYVFFSIIILFILLLPLISAHKRPLDKIRSLPQLQLNESSINNSNALYDSMDLDRIGLSKQTFDYALKGFNHLVKTGRIENDSIISIADFSLPSSAKRLFVIDLNQVKVIFNTYVAHGVNSGTGMAKEFSNKPESNKSSLGFYETLNTYNGGHGYSLRIDGLEKGINDNANRRDIVIHGAAYVNEALIQSQGYIGRSWGCPSLPQKLSRPIINKIKDGSCLFIYSQDISYLHRSKIINA